MLILVPQNYLPIIVISMENLLNTVIIGRLRFCVPPSPKTMLPRYIRGRGQIFRKVSVESSGKEIKLNDFPIDNINIVANIWPIPSTIKPLINEQYVIDYGIQTLKWWKTVHRQHPFIDNHDHEGRHPIEQSGEQFQKEFTIFRSFLGRGFCMWRISHFKLLLELFTLQSTIIFERSSQVTNPLVIW